MKPVEPIETVDLFPGLSLELLGLLKGLPAADWNLPTACAGWSVKDVTAHLLGGNLGRLSRRDRLGDSTEPKKALSYAELLEAINRGNAAWVVAARRISAPLLIQFLELTDAQLYPYFKSLAPFAPAGAEVAWAGDTQSPNWFDIAREYTEKWLHQQHIREALGQPVLAQRQWLFAVMDTFMRALPFTYRAVQAAPGTCLLFRVTGEAGGNWSLLRLDGRWQLFAGEPAEQAQAVVTLSTDVAWRLFTRGMPVEAAREQVQFAGDEALGAHILRQVAIMA